MSHPKHGPDDECSQCQDCPECDGNATYGHLVELAPGVLTLRCPTCGGAGVWCPNYDFDPTA